MTFAQKIRHFYENLNIEFSQFVKVTLFLFLLMDRFYFRNIIGYK